jgi:hypothetical protein
MVVAAVLTALVLIGGLLFLLGRNAERRAMEQRSRRGAVGGGIAAGDGGYGGYGAYGGSEGVSGDHCGFGGDSGSGGDACH